MPRSNPKVWRMLTVFWKFLKSSVYSPSLFLQPSAICKDQLCEKDYWSTRMPVLEICNDGVKHSTILGIYAVTSSLFATIIAFSSAGPWVRHSLPKMPFFNPELIKLPLSVLARPRHFQDRLPVHHHCYGSVCLGW